MAADQQKLVYGRIPISQSPLSMPQPEIFGMTNLFQTIFLMIPLISGHNLKHKDNSGHRLKNANKFYKRVNHRKMCYQVSLRYVSHTYKRNIYKPI